MGARETCLANGIKVLTERMEGVRSVAVGAWVRAGSVHDPAGREGAAHLLEHMAFRGTWRRSRLEIATALEGLGGSLNASTSREHTVYEARVLDRHLPVAMDVLADLVRRPLLREDDLERERQVVCEEIAAVEDTPDDLVFDLHAARMWRGHRYGEAILGSRESVSRTSRDDLARLRSRSHVGANLILAAAGRVDHDDFVALADAWFGDVDPGESTVQAPPPPDPMRGLAWRGRESAQAHIVFGAAAPGRTHPDRFALMLLNSAVGGGMSSLLFQRIREEMALAYAVYSYHAAYLRAGVFGVYLGARPECAAPAIGAVGEVLEEVASFGLSAAHLDRTREQVKGEVALALESPGARVGRLASFALAGRAFEKVDRLIARIDAVDGADIARVAAEVARPDLHCVLCLGPTDPGLAANHPPDNGRAAWS